MERLGKYTLLRRLTSGGMAELFLARQSGAGGFEKMVVIKRLLPSMAADDVVIRMFLNEARIAARLNHPNVAQIYDLGAVGDRYFIAMEYVNGHDLAEVQTRAAEMNEPLGYDLIVYMMQKVCSGLDHAHTLVDGHGRRMGLVHRDVSPENVLLSFGGEVKLVDFGIAKATAMAAETQVGLLKGKFAYMSPEQCRTEALDARSDLFSVGVLLYEMVCRRRLFRRQNDLATMRAVTEDPIPPPSAVVDDVPDGLEQTILRALERDVEKRFQTARELEQALEDVAREERWNAGPANAAEHMAKLFPLAEQLAGESEPIAESDEPTVGDVAALSAAQIDEGPTVAATSTYGSPSAEMNPFGRLAERPSAAFSEFDELPAAGRDIAEDPTIARLPGGSMAVRGDQSAVSAWASAPTEIGEERHDTYDGIERADDSLSTPPLRALNTAEQSELAVSSRGRWVLYLMVPVLLLLAAAAVLLSFKLRDSARTGYPVAVSSEPAGAAVYVDGEKRFGTTPMEVHGLSRGRDYTLLLVLEGFRPWQQRLLLDGSAVSRTVSAKLQPVGPGGEPGSIAVETNVVGAEVFLDGEAQDGKTPTVVRRVRSGERHTLVVRKDGYDDAKLDVAPLAAGEHRSLTIRLQPAGEAEGSGQEPPEKAPHKKEPAKKHRPVKKKAVQKAGVAPPPRTPNLQSPIESKIGEHVPK